MKATQPLRIALGGLLLASPLLSAQEPAPVPAPPAPAVPEAKPAEKEEIERTPVDNPTPRSMAQDPFAPSFSDSGSGEVEHGISAARAGENRVRLRLRLEIWEAPALEVAKRLDGLSDAAALAKMRQECLAGAPGVKLVQSPVTAIDASTRMEQEAITEMIYPTEYEPPELPPSTLTPADARKPTNAWERWLEAAGKYAVPTSFETRNNGATFEALAQPVTIEQGSWDVALSYRRTEHPGSTHYGDDSLMIEMPIFTTFRTGGLLRLKEGEWRLLSVMEPPRGPEGKASELRWVSLVKIERER